MSSPTDRRATLLAIFAVILRLSSAALAFAANIVFPSYQNQSFTMWEKANAFWDPFVRYDSGWYFQIARNGYHYTPNGRDNIAYFPLYPLLMRYIGRLFGGAQGEVYLAGVVVSWAAFVLAVVAFSRLAELDLPRRRAERAAILLAVFPFAFFFGVVYTESVFLLLTVLAFYGFRTRQWVLGGVAGALATATRVNGILILPALGLVAWRAAEPTVRDRVRAAIALVSVTTGVLAYCAFIYRLTSIPGGSASPFEWAATLERWGYYPGGAPWVGSVRLISALMSHPYRYFTSEPMAPYDTLNDLTAIVFVVAIPFIWRRLGAGYGVYMVVSLWLPLSSGQYEGLGRYCAVLFPFFIWLGSARSRLAWTAIVVVSALFYGLCLALFATVHPLF